MKIDLLYNLLTVMVLFISSDLPKYALCVITGVLFGVIVNNNLLDLFVLEVYITVGP